MAEKRVEWFVTLANAVGASVIVVGIFFIGYVHGMKRINREYEKVFNEKFFGIGLGHHLNLYPSGLIVSDVYPGTPAEKAGIQKLDLILSINDGNATSDRLSYVATSGTAVRLKIRRGDRIFEKIVMPELMKRELIVTPVQ